jgi:hypothetical protein
MQIARGMKQGPAEVRSSMILGVRGSADFISEATIWGIWRG